VWKLFRFRNKLWGNYVQQSVLYCIKTLKLAHIPQRLGIKHEKEWKCIETNRKKSVNRETKSISNRQSNSGSIPKIAFFRPQNKKISLHHIYFRTIFFHRKTSKRHEGFAPLLEAFAAIGLLFLIGAAGFLQPITKQLVVLLQQQVLAQHDVSLVVAFLFQSFAQHLSNAGEIRHGFIAHWLGDEVPMFLRSRRHGFG